MFDQPQSSAIAARLRQRIALELARGGEGGVGAIPAAMTFREWCEGLAARGMLVDRKPFSLTDRPALVPIYDAIPSTTAEASGRMVVIQKATQLGLTVWETLADLYMARKWRPVNIGLFLPDQNTAAFKSERRFMPIVRSTPELYRELTHRLEEGKDRHIGEGNVLTREFANSLLMFLWTTGKVSTESRPMDVVSLDEVQEMTLDQIDKARARMGDSEVAFTLMLSTANMPDLDINFWYKEGTQEVWHTECPHCGAFSDLSDPTGTFPAKSIGYNTGQIAGAPLDEYVWTCPVCGGWIEDPQRGRYIAQNPNADPKIRSFLLPRAVHVRQALDHAHHHAVLLHELAAAVEGFLASYADLRDDAMVWGDDLSRSDRKTAEEDRTRYTITLNQYRCMQTTLHRVRDRMCLFPDPDRLEQDVIDNGQTRRIPILRDWVFHHFTKTALVVEQDEATRKPRPKVLKVGIDPYFSFAAMLCDVAWARAHGTSSIYLPQRAPEIMESDPVTRLEKTMPGLPRDIIGYMTQAPEGTCGRCYSYKGGRCTDREFAFGATDPGCPLYVERVG